MRFLRHFVLLLPMLLVTGCLSTDPGPAASSPTPMTPTEETPTPSTPEVEDDGAKVVIEGFRFQPARLEVEVGTKVEWRNEDSASHTSTSTDGTWDSGRLETDEQFSFTFDEEGVFEYVCDLHSSMNGTVVVGTPPEPTPNEPTDPTPTSPTPPEDPEPRSVDIQNFAFDPSSLSVPAGTEVTWTNRDASPHTVTDEDGAFDSGNMITTATFSFTFTAAGTYEYVCEYHSSMRASVTVT